MKTLVIVVTSDIVHQGHSSKLHLGYFFYKSRTSVPFCLLNLCLQRSRNWVKPLEEIWGHWGCTLEYLITVQHLLNVHYGKLDFIWLAKMEKSMLNWWPVQDFSINLNAQHVNGMTPFDLAVHMYGY